jgi:dynein light chain 4
MTPPPPSTQGGAAAAVPNPPSAAAAGKPSASMYNISNSNSSNEQEALRKLMTKPLVKYHDMTPEVFAEAVELITMAVDKHVTSKNYEAAATVLKNTFDKKFGSNWHCIIGEGFGFEVTHQHMQLVYVFYGQVGVLCFKI